ncbi:MULTISPECIES: CDP-diacylglycerol--serine O-phosphatidyltransferase [Limibacillus]|jgi:CDP-diacylglycerol--serine O-phosphatidyltransferase|uniref:CDP-diacylglycerol--serine O-phosphatidyltransferase n=1 Tax=Limibacillus halophilus TaxID=1579333 RepID=A0A839SUV8_9PROT|nr:CDP-diacylglycerol--serine O-phosphatidyltransferase [Limibacillus halophilus]MBB3066262.1 CDP-diacylglycerol--serine O-phosphatidyltransferase [Limibacillus halophilus]
MPESRRRKAIPIRFLIPSLMTVLAICAGLTSIRFAIDGRQTMAVYLILLAALLDGMDGRVARLLKGTSKFGAELDSLADFVNFGVAPGLLLYLSLLQGTGPLAWLSALIFVICCGLRLARFNVMAQATDGPAWGKEFYVGVPAPAAGLLALLPLFLHFLGVSVIEGAPVLAAFYLIFVGFLAVSRIPTFAVKKVSIRRDLLFPTLLGMAAFVAFLFTNVWLAMTLGSLLYLGSLPLSLRAKRRRFGKGEDG